ncbi:hypothetical protein SAMD00019534_076310 [Acytostelium subglobosum LB1]|uniref:hypothetical protein n=1 Tax=Acytostelium subglobosum LB1 TaxID=1410327 RepID=UPI000644F524|nr:hypothetical protein SAMD00019534_076310 [Acytostelium subglobosum LB1]GAM24456.1 hypothetical protein SAMD00019534_076310 [Acytostelium subglobosum LB1]|eukprot:XP_012752782.1 hypothetical protein SAMD00019534_076310 [Acytostelium subglobosum LB1]
MAMDMGESLSDTSSSSSEPSSKLPHLHINHAIDISPKTPRRSVVHSSPDYGCVRSLNLESSSFTSFPFMTGQSLLSLRSLLLGHNPKIEIESCRLQWSAFRHLESISIDRCHLQSIPTGLTNIKTLTELNLNSNMIRTLPPDIEKWTRLKTLQLSNNMLTCLPTYMDQLTCLSTLILNGNRLINVDVTVRIPTLIELNLDNNMLTPHMVIIIRAQQHPSPNQHPPTQGGHIAKCMHVSTIVMRLT